MYTLQNAKNPINYGSGIAEFALVAPKSWFAEGGIMSPVAPFGVIPGDSISIYTPHTWAASRANPGFLKIQLAPQKNKTGSKVVGDLGMQKLNQDSELFFAGNDPASHELMQNLINVPLVVLLKDAKCSANMYYQLGCDCTFAWLGADFDTSTTKDGNKGFTVKIQYDGAIQFYNPMAAGAAIPPVVMADPTTTTSTKLASPVNLYADPTNPTTNGRVVLLFASISHASGYNIDVSLVPDFSTKVTGYNNLLFTSAPLMITGLAASTLYYIRVRAVDSTSVYTTSDYGFFAASTVA